MTTSHYLSFLHERQKETLTLLLNIKIPEQGRLNEKVTACRHCGRTRAFIWINFSLVIFTTVFKVISFIQFYSLAPLPV